MAREKCAVFTCTKNVTKETANEVNGGYYCNFHINDALKQFLYTGNPPEFKMLKNSTDTDELFIGFELETEHKKFGTDGFLAKDFLSFLKGEGLKDYFFLKFDGSLDNGFELLSSPFLLKYGKQNLKLLEIIRWLNGNGYSTNRTHHCGFHIHINRKYLEDDGVIKMRAFFSLNYAYLHQFSERISTHYCGYEKFVLDSFLKQTVQQGRYHALNLNTRNQKTVEIRIFHGTLNYKKIMAYLEFADAISRYCKKYTLEDIICAGKPDTSWGDFIEWVRHYNISYPYLLLKLKRDQLLEC
jgi:hypothetical protein